MHLLVHAKCVKDQQGVILGVSGTAYDITERILAEKP